MTFKPWLLVGLIVTLTPHCQQASPEAAPFAASPPPLTCDCPPASAPVAPAEAEAAGGTTTEGLEHIHGEDRWPCKNHPICDVGSPEDGVLHMPIFGVEFLDPNRTNESSGIQVLDDLFEGLLVRPPRSDQGPQPGVAERWTSSPDGRVWTFFLRDDARWSNGRTVTAHDFVYSWKRILSPELGSRTAEQLWLVKGGEDYTSGKVKNADQVGVKALDDRTLEVTLENPSPFWLSLLVGSTFAPVPREAIETHGNAWTRPEHMVTNGPYVLSEHEPRSHIRITRSETYWDRASIRIPQVRYMETESAQEATRHYDLNQLHFQTGSLPSEKIATYISEGRPDFFIDPYLCFYYYAFRMDRPPFDDAKVRRAVNMAIDKPRLVKHITRALQVPADGPMPALYEETMGYEKSVGDGYDPEAAKRLLTEAGYPNGHGMPPITLIYNTLEGHRLIAEFVQRSLSDNLGIEVRIENMEWKSLLKRLTSGDFQMARAAWCCIPDPWDHFMIFKSTSANNYGGYANAELDALFDASNRTTDQPTRMALFRRMEQIVQRDVPIAPLYHYTKSYLKMPVLRGVFPDLENKHLVRYMYWGDREAQPHPLVQAAETANP